MFLAGPFMALPFLGSGGTAVAGSFAMAGMSSAQFAGTSVRSRGWDRMLAQDGVKLAYFAEIEPWVLADRS